MYFSFNVIYESHYIVKAGTVYITLKHLAWPMSQLSQDLWVFLHHLSRSLFRIYIYLWCVLFNNKTQKESE